MFAAVGRRELKNEDEGSSCSRALAAAERFVHAVSLHSARPLSDSAGITCGALLNSSGLRYLRYLYHYHCMCAMKRLAKS